MKNLFFFICLPILFTTVGEFILKHHINLAAQVSTSTGFLAEMGLIIDPGIIIAFTFIISGGILWVIAMSKFELSFLYPFLSINYLGIIVGSQFFLGEKVSLYRYLSIVLIIMGLIIISRSPNSENKEPPIGPII
jgi:drug/metabolite transporter (DMT)-like permease